MAPMFLMLSSGVTDVCLVLCRDLLIGSRRLAAIAISFVFCLGLNIDVEAATFVVNATGDSSDAAPGNGSCNTGGTNSQGAAECTLRAAVEEANAFAGGDTINFNMPVTEPGYSAAPLSYTTQPATALPTISTLVVIDGSSQPDFPGMPIVVLDGISAGAGVHGLQLANGSDGSTIRGLQIIRFSANGLEIQFSADGLTVSGNWIGSDGSGASAPGNGNNGINMLAANATIGGTGAFDRNVINNNGNEGINLTGGGATGNSILGNYIGLESDGTSGSGNGDVGIALLTGATGNTIGGFSVAARNVISMNFEGIEINTANNIVVGNYIGADASGTLDRGNRSDDGVEIQGGGNNNTIGGTAAGASNLIAFNQLHGINVAAGTGNRILGNSIHSNDQLGIDLGNDGVTANDGDDVDSGPNDLLNFPMITSVTHSGGNLTVDFVMEIPPGDYRVEFFINPTGADPSGNGEGQTYADSITVSDGGGGPQNFSHSFPGAVGDIVSPTTTQEFAGPTYGSTSEFGPAMTALPAGDCPGGQVRNTDDSGSRSLRECILFANVNPGTTITFDISGAGNRSAGADSWFAISPVTLLPTITAAGTIIDGMTQTTNRGDSNSLGPEIEIDGVGAGVNANGLVIGTTANGSDIRGLAIGNFSDNGILVQGANNVIAGNYLGLSADGTTVAANNTNDVTYQGGIRVESANNTIGGNTPADRNVISGNFFAGVELFGAAATGNQIDGNYIGVDATGTIDRGNSQEGIDLELSGSNRIGGPTAAERNIVSGNGSDGIEIDGGDFNQVWGNYIGTDVTGTIAIPNDRDGIDINENGGNPSTNNLIGGISSPNDGNLIRGNSIYGVSVRGAGVIDNTIHGNRIYGNVALDIDLNDDGITVNDALDADAGPNELLNYPEFIAAEDDSGTVSVFFSLNVPAGDHRIEFFTNPAGAHASGSGGGEVIAGATMITHGGTGDELFGHTFAGSAGDTITATATEHVGGPFYGSTSEFSAPVTATSVAPITTARWPLDETSGLIAFEIDAGNDGDYRNGVLLNQTAACANTGNAVFFDGIDDYVEVPHASGYRLDEGTVSLWANVEALTASQQTLFSKDSTSFDTGGHLTITVEPTGEIQVRLQSTTASMFVTTVTQITPGTWFHVAFSWGPGGMRLYLDGAAPITDPYTGGLGTTSGGVGNFEPIAFGAATMNSGDLGVTPLNRYFRGYLDDVRINNRELTQPEIQTLAGCAGSLDIVKRAFWPDSTAIPTGATIPSGVEFKYLLYVNNPGGLRTDVTVRDVLDPAFQYQTGTIKIDNSLAECGAAVCTPVEEQAIFTAVDGTAILTDAVDGDVASFAGAIVDAGDGNVGNLQLDINGSAVWAILFSAKMP